MIWFVSVFFFRWSFLFLDSLIGTSTFLFVDELLKCQALMRREAGNFLRARTNPRIRDELLTPSPTFIFFFCCLFLFFVHWHQIPCFQRPVADRSQAKAIEYWGYPSIITPISEWSCRLLLKRRCTPYSSALWYVFPRETNSNSFDFSSRSVVLPIYWSGEQNIEGISSFVVLACQS